MSMPPRSPPQPEFAAGPGTGNAGPGQAPAAPPSTDGASEARQAGSRRRRITRIAQILMAAAAIAAVFAYAIPQVAGYSSVWAVLRKLTWPQAGLLAAATVFNLFTYWAQLAASMPRLTLAQAAVNNQTTSSIANTMPGGGVVAIGAGYSMSRSWGFSPAQIALSAMLTGIWNSFIKLAMPIAAVALLALTGNRKVALLIPALAGIAALAAAITAFGLVVARKSYAYRIGTALERIAAPLLTIIRRPPVTGWGDAAVRFRRQTNDLAARRWPALTASTVISHVSLYLVLLLCVRVVGISGTQVNWPQVLGIFSLARLLTAAPITPGGVGVVELAYIGGLVLAGGGPIRAQAVAAVLLFRLLTYGLQIPLGAITYPIWQRKASWRKPVA